MKDDGIDETVPCEDDDSDPDEAVNAGVGRQGLSGAAMGTAGDWPEPMYCSQGIEERHQSGTWSGRRQEGSE